MTRSLKYLHLGVIIFSGRTGGFGNGNIPRRSASQPAPIGRKLDGQTLNHGVEALPSYSLTQDVLTRKPPIGNGPKQRHVPQLQKSIGSKTAKLYGLPQNIGKVEPVVGEQPRVDD
jgi:hypothetical protein